MKRTIISILVIFLALNQCQEIPEYPDVPYINYETFFLYITINSLDQEVVTGELNFSFTDGDGNIGFDPLPDTLAIGLPDSVRYNLFLQMYNIDDRDTVLVDEDDGGFLKYVIPFLDKQPLAGTVSVTIEYPIINYDSIIYTFFLYDREYNKSNMDTTDLIDFSFIDLD